MQKICFYIGVSIRILCTPLAIPIIFVLGGLQCPNDIWEVICMYYKGE